MSIGTRITQIRKKNNLSQEAFGETLGVSRQAISKWEMDASIPDVDKLILMSQIYDVSVGYILGIEEEKAEVKDAWSGESRGGENCSSDDRRGEKHGELTPEQLRMVEEIVNRYIAAMPAPEPPKRNDSLMVAAFAGMLFMILLFNTLKLSDSISAVDHKYQAVTENLQGLYNKVDDLEYDISTRLEEQLQNVLDDAYEMVIDYGWKFVSYDAESNNVTLSVYAEAKVYSQETLAEFVVVSGGQETKVKADQEDGRFFAEITFPRSNQWELRLLLTNDGVTETKELEVIADMLRVELPKGWVLGGASLRELPLENGVLRQEDHSLRMSMGTSMTGPMGTSQPVKVTITYYVNGEKYVSFDAPVQIVEDKAQWEHTYDLEIPLAEGDTVVDVIGVTDAMGRQARTIRESYEVKSGELTAWGGARLSELQE